ncbi:ABC transporter permease [Anaeromyxobacter oryzae]|uniref:ABC-2 type transporter transmembrane domain-containing protein n=1 Tax=Anaeromyxobacter oryzae TaxID=2918170 RepID=A0ABM7X0U7_9BACT|nr:ABC transporter permease [Anaeromyxobacter oryzae]BDG05427.1 hypothetical protein AMOR_44230 [Anaeromyxobacter oryzae]
MSARDPILRPVLALARKDLVLLLRSRGHLFFSFGWPILMAVLFGLVFGGRAGGDGTITVAIVDEDGSPAAARLVARLRAEPALELVPAAGAEAERLVRSGERVAAIVVPAGYGDTADRLFRGQPLRLELLVDPSRKAEAAMLEGVLTGAAFGTISEIFTDDARARALVDRSLADLRAAPADRQDRASLERLLRELGTFLDARPAAPAGAPSARPAFQPVAIARRALEAREARPGNAFDFTFPQGILWGVIGCALGFAQSLVGERTRGTLARLQVAPLSAAHVLAGKALACFVTIAALEAALLAAGRGLGMRPASWPLLAVAAVCVDACFVGIMMAVAAAGRDEQAAGGLGWALMMPLALFGGGMIPLFILPGWMQAVGAVSPVRWGILALEGAIWRGFGAAELARPCLVLLAFGAMGFALGARTFRARP